MVYLATRRPQLVGHMGYPAKQPANTVLSARAAVAAGADMVEIDVSVTVDGHAIAIHGPYLDQTTTGTGRVAKATLGDIKSLGITSEGEVVAGVDVPLVSDIVDAVEDVSFNFDLKSSAARDVVLALIADRQMAHRCVISGATAWQVGKIRRSAPDVTVLLNLNRFDKVVAATGFGARWLVLRYRRLLRKPEVAALNIHHTWVTADLVARVADLGSEVWAFTVDQQADVDRLVSLGVASITTNRVGEVELDRP
jgi:glycerophosphoryl diester phosphodiesterase